MLAVTLFLLDVRRRQMQRFLVPLAGLALLVGCSQGGGDTPSGGGDSPAVTNPADSGGSAANPAAGDTVVFHVGMD